MAFNNTPFQPGAMLHDAIMGAFKASGGSFEAWCIANSVTPSTARNCTYGQMKGPKGRKLLEKLILAAGPDVVRAGYIARLKRHVDLISQTEGAA